MRKKIIISLSIAAIFLVAALLYKENENEPIYLGGQKFRIETVRDQDKKIKGLAGRKSICPECGMLFVFEKPGRHSFWMRDMQFPLDIIWISGGEIVYIEKDIPQNSGESFDPEVLADKVLEINAGLSEKYGLKVGDKIKNL